MGEKHAAAAERFSAALQIQKGDEQAQNVQKSEQLYSNLQNAFGQEGTYAGSPGFAGGDFTGGQGVPSGGGSIFEKASVSDYAMQLAGAKLTGKDKRAFNALSPEEQAKYGDAETYSKEAGEGMYGGHRRLREMAGKTINVEAATKAAKGSKQFQMLSQLTAEANQMMQREGPAWERLEGSVIGPIKEAGAQSMEASLDSLNNMYASGGTARNKALQQAMRMQAQSDVNFKAYAQVSQANAAMDGWIRSNAKQQTAFNQSWSQNVAGVRQAYLGNINAANNYMGQVAIPAADANMATAAQIGSSAKKDWMGVAIGVGMIAVGAVVSIIPGGAALGAPLMAAGAAKTATSAGGMA